MNKQVKQILRILAGVLFLLVALRGRNGYITVDEKSGLETVLSLISCILLAVALFIQQDKLLIAGALVSVICHLPSAIGGIIEIPAMLKWYAPIYSLRMVLFYLALFLASLFLFLGIWKKNYTQSMCIAIVVLAVIHFLAEALIVGSLFVVQQNLLLWLAIVLTAIVLAENAHKVTPKAVSQPTQSGASQIENLTKLKELMDSGVITQEEFDAKKKQLLGL